MQANNITTTKKTLSYVNEVFHQISSKPNISDVVIVNSSGNPVKYTMNTELAAIEFAGLFGSLLDKASKGLKTIHPNNEILMIRVRTKHNENIITPDGNIIVMVVQEAVDQFAIEK